MIQLRAEDVESQMINSVVHLANTLFVEFNNGSIYRLDGIGKGVVDEMLKAESKGRFYNKHLRRLDAVKVYSPKEDK